ncbi:MAG TPA: hypothetical protein VEU62_15840 [Bryobacterales bacterium]|nr:hypothetical protein [Bryobacterales bacterium]
MAERIATFYTRAIEGNERRVVALVLGAYLVALGWQAWRVGLTYDEPTHMLGSYLYWLDRPDLYPRDFPPLIKIATGWVPRALHIPLYPELPQWKRAWKQDVAAAILDHLEPEQIQQLFYLMRLAAAIFPMLTALLLWHWGRLLWGPRVALLLLLAWVLLPTPLAHGCLLKNDLATTFTYLLFAFCGWRFWLAPSRRNSALLGMSVLLALLAKLSLLIAVPLGVLLVAARAVWPPRPAGRRLAFALASVLLIPYIGLLASYRFEARRLTEQDLRTMLYKEGFSRWDVAAAHVFRLVPTPEDLQTGVRSLNTYQKYGAPIYLLGRARTSGSLAYFPVALAIKTPIALQILFFAGLILVAQRIASRRAAAADWFLLAPGLLYVSLAAQSNLQLGVRLVLPGIPFFLLLGGFAIERALAGRAGQAALAAVFVWLAAASISIYPQGIAYFNEWVGGPQQGWKYLSDSNVDWGQNLPELAAYIRRNHVQHLKLYYWGYGQFRRYGIQDIVQVQPPPWPQFHLPNRLVPQQGLYAVSVMYLHGQFFDAAHRDYFHCFQVRMPEARAGYSIFIYKVD